MELAPRTVPLRTPGDVSRTYPALVPRPAVSPQSVNTPDHTVTVREAAALLGVSRITILDRLKRGELRGERRPIPGGFAWRVELPAAGTRRCPMCGRWKPLDHVGEPPIHELQEDV